jgi:hypothetical protein
MRSVNDILSGDASTWASLTVEQLRSEHETLRRALQVARRQIEIWSPLVAWRHVEGWRSTLAYNLSIAGGLCESFDRGSTYRMRAMIGLPADEDWKPGCGRAAT